MNQQQQNYTSSVQDSPAGNPVNDRLFDVDFDFNFANAEIDDNVFNDAFGKILDEILKISPSSNSAVIPNSGAGNDPMLNQQFPASSGFQPTEPFAQSSVRAAQANIVTMPAYSMPVYTTSLAQTIVYNAPVAYTIPAKEPVAYNTALPLLAPLNPLPVPEPTVQYMPVPGELPTLTSLANMNQQQQNLTSPVESSSLRNSVNNRLLDLDFNLTNEEIDRALLDELNLAPMAPQMPSQAKETENATRPEASAERNAPPEDGFNVPTLAFEAQTTSGSLSANDESKIKRKLTQLKRTAEASANGHIKRAK